MSKGAPRVSPVRWADETGDLQGFQKSVVLSMVPDPEPCNLVVLHYADGSVCEGDTDRIDGLAVVDFLELQAGMLRVLAEEAVGLSSEFSGFQWQLAVRRPEARRRVRRHNLSGSSGVVRPAARSARASAASLLNAS